MTRSRAEDGCHEQWREAQRRAAVPDGHPDHQRGDGGRGSIIALAGLPLGAGHMMRSTRRWVDEMDVPVSQLAKAKFGQARAAMSAGAQAWQKNGSGTVPVSAGY